MAYLVSDVTERARQDRAAYPPDSDPMALQFVAEAHFEIIRDAGLYVYTDVDISLVQGQREYALDPLIYRIENATYYSSATGYQPIWETSVDQLDAKYRTWRSIGQGRPYRYYEQGGKVGFWRTPDTTTNVSGYPLVRLNVLSATLLTSVSDSLPAQTPLMDAWVYGALKRFSIGRDLNDVALYDALRKDALETLKRFTFSKLIRQKPSIDLRVPRISNP